MKRRMTGVAAAACLSVASLAGAAAADTFETSVDGLEVMYGGIVGDTFEETTYDFGTTFNAIWEPQLLLTGFTDAPGSTLTFTGFIDGKPGDPVSIVSDGFFQVTVPVPPAVGMLSGQGTVGLQLETFLQGGADLSSTVSEARLVVQGIPVVLVPFEGCGTLIPTDECIVFESDGGGIYAISDLGPFGIGDEVHVAGIVDPNCITICLAANSGCIDVDTITACCPADTNGDGLVNVLDLLNVILDWGGSGAAHGGDVDGSGTVDVLDLLEVILQWGGC